MNHLDDDSGSGATAVSAASGEETALEQRAAAGDKEAFDQLYDRYLARLAWYFTIFSAREAKVAVAEVMVELFGSLANPTDRSLARRAYDLARATEVRHVTAREKAKAGKGTAAKSPGAGVAKVEMSEEQATFPLRA